MSAWDPWAGKLFLLNDEEEPSGKRLVEVVYGRDDARQDFTVCFVRPFGGRKPARWVKWSRLSDEITNPMEVLAWAARP